MAKNQDRYVNYTIGKGGTIFDDIGIAQEGEMSTPMQKECVKCSTSFIFLRGTIEQCPHCGEQYHSHRGITNPSIIIYSVKRHVKLFDPYPSMEEETVLTTTSFRMAEEKRNGVNGWIERDIVIP